MEPISSAPMEVQVLLYRLVVLHRRRQKQHRQLLQLLRRRHHRPGVRPRRQQGSLPEERHRRDPHHRILSQRRWWTLPLRPLLLQQRRHRVSRIRWIVIPLPSFTPIKEQLQLKEKNTQSTVHWIFLKNYKLLLSPNLHNKSCSTLYSKASYPQNPPPPPISPTDTEKKSPFLQLLKNRRNGPLPPSNNNPPSPNPTVYAKLPAS